MSGRSAKHFLRSEGEEKAVVLETIVVAGLMHLAGTVPRLSFDGVWSIGETANGATGSARVLHKGGYYPENGMPDNGAKAVRMWGDDAATIDFTTSRMPFAEMANAARPGRFMVGDGTRDSLVMDTHDGRLIIFNPPSSISSERQ
jgi:hypothetical protein